MTSHAAALHLAEIVAARLCHDFSGLIGTLDGALEATAEELATPEDAAADAAETLGLAREAAAELRLRLRLWRAAWAGIADPMTIADLFALLRALPAARQRALTATGLPDDVALAPEDARVILNVLILAIDAAGEGGFVHLAGQPEGDFVVMLEGAAARWPAGLSTWLSDDAAALAAVDTPRAIPGPLAVLIARASGARLSLLLATGTGGGPPPLLVRLAEG